jgi:hypothetical protein
MTLAIPVVFLNLPVTVLFALCAFAGYFLLRDTGGDGLFRGRRTVRPV